MIGIGTRVHIDSHRTTDPISGTIVGYTVIPGIYSDASEPKYIVRLEHYIEDRSGMTIRDLVVDPAIVFVTTVRM